jgi:hypothetical protein
VAEPPTPQEVRSAVEQRYYVQPSGIGWQVRDNETQRVVERDGSLLIFKTQSAANRARRAMLHPDALRQREPKP